MLIYPAERKHGDAEYFVCAYNNFNLALSQLNLTTRWILTKLFSAKHDICSRYYVDKSYICKFSVQLYIQ